MVEFIITEDEVCKLIGLSESTLPEPFTVDDVSFIINNISKLVQEKTNPFKLTNFEEIFSSRYLEADRILRTKYKKIQSIKVYERLMNSTTWRELPETDYYVDNLSGRLVFYHRILPKFGISDAEYSDIKIVGTYGTNPTFNQLELIKILSAIKLIVSIYGTDINQKSVEGFSLGDFTSSVRALTSSEGTQYLDTLEKEKNRLMEEVGIINSERKIKFRVV